MLFDLICIVFTIVILILGAGAAVLATKEYIRNKKEQ